MTTDLDFLSPYFLGPAAENENLLEELLVEFLRDHAFWRRNFHPEDGQRISPMAPHSPEFLAFQARTRTELYRLSADLKRAVPFFHPRYVGHMSSDLLLPGLVAKILTTLYNPNNVSEEAAPVTLDKELEVGEQLARMFGFAVDDEAEPCAWGHLTSGGTVANYEALWNFRSVKFYGLALQAGAAACGFDPDGVGPRNKRLSTYDEWELVNLSIDEMVDLRRTVARLARGLTDRKTFHRFAASVRAERIESLGTAEFFARHEQVRPPVVLVPVSGHYSWEKGMKVLGLGTANLVPIQVDDHMRMDVAHLRACLDQALQELRPVLGVVGMLGSTEFGTFDPIHEIVAAREELRPRGLDFGIHVDGAWGGYLTSVFRDAAGEFVDRDRLRAEFRYFPSETVYEAFRAIGRTDSVTVDPHKLGYLPYPAGAFVARNREVVDFITQQAAYVFDLGEQPRRQRPREKLRSLGQYILEGSKPGSAAAAVWVTHRVLPLDGDGLGRLLKVTIRATEEFWDSARVMTERLADRAHLCVPFEPDSNLICLALNPVGNRDLAVMNRFGRRVFSRMRVDASEPVQVKRFIASYTSLSHAKLPGDESHRILEALGIDPSTFVGVPEEDTRESDHIFILRHTLMNPWLLDGPEARSYIELYWDHLERLVDEALAERDEWTFPGEMP